DLFHLEDAGHSSPYLKTGVSRLILMNKHILAQQLRQRQVRLGYFSREFAAKIPDDVMIDCYITCHCCGQKQVEGADLNRIILEATTSDEFLDLCNNASKIHKSPN